MKKIICINELRSNNFFNRILIVSVFILLIITSLGTMVLENNISTVSGITGTEIIKLPKPILESAVSVEQAFLKRKSIRDYKNSPLSLEEVGQLLWAAQGITPDDFNRTVPSAGALYPIEIYLICGSVTDLPAGIYKYNTEKHHLEITNEGDKRKELQSAALHQSSISKGAIDLVITAVTNRATKKYKERGMRYIQMEAGHSAQNICLEAVSLKLGTVTIGAFNDDKVKNVLNLLRDEVPLYILPVGKLKKT